MAVIGLSLLVATKSVFQPKYLSWVSDQWTELPLGLPNSGLTSNSYSFHQSTLPKIVPYALWKSLSHVWLCVPMDYSLPGFSVHVILQGRIMEWVAIPFSRGSSQVKDRTRVSRIADRFFIIWATREAQGTITISYQPRAPPVCRLYIHTAPL